MEVVLTGISIIREVVLTGIGIVREVVHGFVTRDWDQPIERLKTIKSYKS